MNDIETVIAQLERQRSAIDRAIAALREIGSPGRNPAKGAGPAAGPGIPRKRRMSAAGRKSISDATKKRWAEKRAAQAQTSASGSSPAKTGPRKRRLSPEGRERIIAATKKRWAAKRAEAGEKAAPAKKARKKAVYTGAA